VQEPVAKVVLTETLELPCLQWLDLNRQFDFKGGEYLYTTPQPQEEHHAKDCALLQIPSRDCDCSQNQEPVATLIEHLAFTDGIIRFYGVENMEQLPVGTEFYTTPQPQRQWVGLTDEEVADLGRHELWIKQFIRIVEAKLKERNHVN
jgi:hypothetical protein